METVKVELTKEEWEKAQVLALDLERLIDGEEGDALGSELVPVRDFLVALANKVEVVPRSWRS